jgi:hypothetical protein
MNKPCIIDNALNIAIAINELVMSSVGTVALTPPQNAIHTALAFVNHDILLPLQQLQAQKEAEEALEE